MKVYLLSRNGKFALGIRSGCMVIRYVACAAWESYYVYRDMEKAISDFAAFSNTDKKRKEKK